MMILGEHSVLLVLGVLLGVATAALAVIPQLIGSSGSLPVAFLGKLIVAVLVFGLLVCVIAVSWPCVGSLRNHCGGNKKFVDGQGGQVHVFD
jgi:putative ABC transport system permease protein